MKHNIEQASALLDSIEHWKRLLKCKSWSDFILEGWHTDDCVLCALYYDATTSCSNDCPIHMKTGKSFCDGSPYFIAALAIRKHINKSFAGIRPISLYKTRKTIRNEIKFLESIVQ